MDNEIPYTKEKLLGQPIPIRFRHDVRAELIKLKKEFGIEYTEWVRRLVDQELPNLKKKVGAA